MPKRSAAILLHRRTGGELEVFLVHPGGPFWAKKDAGAWSLPKGQYEPGEDPLEAAKREFNEETGFEIDGDFLRLEPVKQRSGKIVDAWAVEGNCDATASYSNTFQMEWPPRSGKMQEFPEVDRAEWFALPAAREKLLESQRPLLDQLEALLARDQ